MFLGKLVGLGVGFWIEPRVGWLFGGMLGHLIDRPIGRYIKNRRESNENRRTQRRARRRSIHQSGVRARGDSSRRAGDRPVDMKTGEVVSPQLLACLETLGARPDESREAVKAHWRQAVSEWHPDSRQARGLPVDDASTARLHDVQRAWETVRGLRGWR